MSAILVFAGGVRVGFGTRYASGCTSGHAITGSSTLQLQSLLAVMSILAEGLRSSHLITPRLFSLFWQVATRFLPCLVAGLAFGFFMIKSEAASCYRIMEMFYFQSLHMFGIMASTVATGLTSVLLLKRYGHILTLDGSPIEIPDKAPGRSNHILGGIIFGLGWGVSGLGPGPIFSLVGAGSIGALAALAGALHGAWLYGFVKNRLPH